MKTSKIFTDAELTALNTRIQGVRSDPTGIFASRVKPKIVEILEWCKHTNTLKKTLEQQHRR